MAPPPAALPVPLPVALLAVPQPCWVSQSAATPSAECGAGLQRRRRGTPHLRRRHQAREAKRCRHPLPSASWASPTTIRCNRYRPPSGRAPPQQRWGCHAPFSRRARGCRGRPASCLTCLESDSRQRALSATALSDRDAAPVSYCASDFVVWKANPLHKAARPRAPGGLGGGTTSQRVKREFTAGRPG